MKQVIKLKRRGFILFITIILLTTFTTNVFGDSLATKLKKQKKQLAQNKATYQNIVDKIDNIESDIEKLDIAVENIMAKINATNIKISRTKYNIKRIEEAINKAGKSIDSEQGLYNQRLKAMYINGPTGYLELILNSKSFIDFLERYELTKSIMKFDTDLIHSLQNKKKNIEYQKSLLVRQNNNLVTLQNQNKARLNELKATKSKQNSLIRTLESQRKKYQKIIDQYSNSINSTLKAIAEMKRRLQNSNSGGKYSSDALVVYAAKFLGVPYVWGGTTPRGFDCSGFTQYVYGHFGIRLNRVSRDQAKQGTYVSRKDLRPGDLMFFGSPIHHVAIYVGNNSFIEAPYTGANVRISQFNRKDFVGGRRLR